jgi:SAM-dependent methyltransferase
MDDWWESFYADGDWDRGAYLGGDDMADHLDAFLDVAVDERTADERTVDDGTDAPGGVDSVASIGCGPAATEFDVATRRPDVHFHCYDVAPAVVDANAEKARREGVENVSFAEAGLPETGIDRTFDVVYCMAVLYFVRDAEAALRELWRLTAPGGHLAFTYPNPAMQTWAQSLDDEDHDKREAFSLVAAGENLLTDDRIREVLDAEPHDYWAAVDADPDAEYVAREGSPAVSLQKPP